jgi:sortase A
MTQRYCQVQILGYQRFCLTPKGHLKAETYIRDAKSLLPGEPCELIDRAGTYHYVVDSTEIVSPDRVQVLDIAARPELTLITCSPFDYVGAAPRRFIVHAHLLSVLPDAASTIR